MKTKKMMKRVVTMIVVLCLALTALTAGAFADNSSKANPAAVCTKAAQDVTVAKLYLDNDSDDDVMEFYMVLASDTSWGNDLCGNYYIRANDGHGDLGLTVTYMPDTQFEVRIVTRSGNVFESSAFDLDGLKDPESVTITFHGTDGDYHIGIR